MEQAIDIEQPPPIAQFRTVGTTLAAGVSHWKFGNIDWKVVGRIGIPGAIGAFLGATVLSWLSTEVAAPIMSLVLLALGVYILVRFTVQSVTTQHLGKPLRRRDDRDVADAIERRAGRGHGDLTTLPTALIAAPIAAWLVRHLPPRLLGSAVGGLIVLTNARTLLRSDWIDASGAVQNLSYAAIVAVWIGAVAWSLREHRREQRELVEADVGRAEALDPA